MSDDEEIDELEGFGDDAEMEQLSSMFGSLMTQREGAINPLARDQNQSQMRKNNRGREELDVIEGFPSRDPKYQELQKLVNPAINRLKSEARTFEGRTIKRFKRPENPDNKTMEDTFGVRPKDKDNNGGGGRGVMT